MGRAATRGFAEVEDASVEGYEPASLSSVAGTDFKRVTGGPGSREGAIPARG
jgi:hypothetical protein